jgi:raffinose/stachyose/melibiose transport system permease protein
MRFLRRNWLDVVAVAVAAVIFLVPFAFMITTAMKTANEASDFRFSWPKKIVLLDNIKEVVKARDGILLTAFKNSILLTVLSVTILIVICSMAAFVLQRRPGKVASVVNMMVLGGLIIPPAIVPTIWVLRGLHIYKSLFGLVLVEVAFGMSFAVLIFRAFIAAIPRELDEAAMIDGCSGVRLFFMVIFPLLRPVIITTVVTQSIFIFNDFVNPLYFLPGSKNATVQLTLFNFISQFNTKWNLLFTDILLITIPPLIMFMIFNRKIVAGMTAGAVKG